MRFGAGATYSVRIAVPPNGQVCIVSNGSGVIQNADVKDATVSCASQTGNNTPPRCIVGDGCPSYRIVSSKGVCAKARSNDVAGNPVDLQANCGFRSITFNDIATQLDFRSNGQISFGNDFCLSAEPGGDALLKECLNNNLQRWTIDNDGRILSSDQQCLVETGSILQLASCATQTDPRWGFIPIESNAPYNVKAVYVTTTDSTRTDRIPLWQNAVAQNQQKWANGGTTWELASEPVAIALDDVLCSDLSLSVLRSATIRELSLRRGFRYNTMYLSVSECEEPSGIAGAGGSVAVFDLFVIDRIESQLPIDPNTAMDRETAEIGAIGHELGHLFGLPHENCIIGGYQGGMDEQGNEIVAGLPTTASRGPMCNGAYYPNVDPISDAQRAWINERSCRWIEECAGGAELGVDGRPYGCNRFENGTFVWDTSRDDLTFTIYKFSFEQAQVTSVSGIPANTYVDPDQALGFRIYYAVSLDGETASRKRQNCGFFPPR